MELLISAFWSILEIISFHFFLSSFLARKTTKKVYFISYASIWLLPIIHTWTVFPTLYVQIISIVAWLALCIINYQGSFLRKILFFVLTYTSLYLIDSVVLYGTSTIIGISVTELVWKKFLYTLIATTSKLTALLICWIVFHVRTVKKSGSLPTRWLLLMLLFPAVSLVMLLTIYNSAQGQEDLSVMNVIFCVFLAVANVAIIYLIQLMEKATEEAKNMALLKQQMEVQTDSILALEQNYRAQRKATHEFHNQLQTIYSLIGTGEYTSAQDYIQQLQGAHPTRIFTINSHHPIIDAVLNHKYQLANDSTIDIRIQVNDLSGVSISTDHIVVLLSNLLDNAIEACLRFEGERIIQCSILASDSLYISIRNTSVPVEIKDNYIPTSKEPKEDHGYGLAHVGFILKQLYAEYILSYNDGWFEFASEIPLEANH